MRSGAATRGSSAGGRPHTAAPRRRLELDILRQPDDFTCGPTCLHSLYHYYGLDVPLSDIIAGIPRTEGGGTLGVYLGTDALRRGFKATILTYNLRVFDPTWFAAKVDLAQRLALQMEAKAKTKVRAACRGYLDFLEAGGKIRLQELTPSLIRSFLNRNIPILTGLSATWLYRSAREFGENDDYDDVRGEPSGHFVVLTGYERHGRLVRVADPFEENPLKRKRNYAVPVERVIGAILLGILTYDANLLIIEPRERRGVAE